MRARIYGAFLRHTVGGRSVSEGSTRPEHGDERPQVSGNGNNLNSALMRPVHLERRRLGDELLHGGLQEVARCSYTGRGSRGASHMQRAGVR